MALFFKDPSYDPSRRMTGFNRYRQLFSLYTLNWMKVNLITCLGALPLALGIVWAILASSSLILAGASLVGGAVFGPFLAGMTDAIMRGMRDAPGTWWANYKKSWKQNAVSSLLPGAVTGLLVGMYAFMIYIMWSSQVSVGWGTIALYLFAAMLMLILSTLYWPQLVLFSQKNGIRLRNAVLLIIQHFWRSMGVALLELAYIALYILFAPWTLVLVPFVGLWFILFEAEYLMYPSLDSALKINEQYYAIEGDPWAEAEKEAEEEAHEEMIRSGYGFMDMIGNNKDDGQ